MEAVLLIGIQGSGKTAFYRERFFDTHVRISLDLLKTRRRERLLLEACLAAGQPFVVDNTNVLAAGRAAYIAPARAARFRIAGYFFRSELREALARNRARSGVRRIPPAGVIATHKRLESPSWPEGFDELHVVRIDSAGGFAVAEWPRDREEPPA